MIMMFNHGASTAAQGETYSGNPSNYLSAGSPGGIRNKLQSESLS